jgi:amino acid adenylation domain-containing protein
MPDASEPCPRVAKIAEPIAVVGLSALLPGSTTVAEFWRNVLRNRCFVRDLPEWVWEQDAFYAADPVQPLASYSRLGALLGDVDLDVTSFRIPPTVAAQMSRNQKLALICAREALHDAGYLDRAFDRERTGVVFAAVAGDMLEQNLQTLHSERLRRRLQNLASDAEQARQLSALWEAYEAAYPPVAITEDTLPGILGSLVAGRIASALDLHGPSLVLDSACASTLAAVATAVNLLRGGQCDMVVAGGVETGMDAGSYVLFAKLSALSATGSYPFDERADGFVMGEGCGALVLKRHADAIRDGDSVYALIRGVGLSSDGTGKAITAPSSDGQLRALMRAYEEAALSPTQIQYLECHGTGTKAGDATELDSVARWVLASDETDPRPTPLPIGSGKANVGHLKTAAGIVGILRGILAVNGRVIPPQVNFERPNPGINWERSRLRVPRRPELLGPGEVCAGVSAFGFGGTNVHVVLSSSPDHAREPLITPADFLLPELPPLPSDVAFLFPGQGSQYVGMLDDWRDDPVAASLLERADAIVAEISGRPLSEVLFPTDRSDDLDRESREAALRTTAVVQPAILLASAILLEHVRQLGLDCGMALGHSLGEYTALYAAGMLSFEEALRAVATRGWLMSRQTDTDPGVMAFVGAGRETVEGLLGQVEGYVTCANINSYDQTVVAGDREAVAGVMNLATARGLQAQLLNVDRAFHSRLVSHCAGPLRSALEGLELCASTTPVPANLSRQVYPFTLDEARRGQPLSAREREQVLDLLCQQVDHPVDFVSQVELAYASGIRRFVEIGPSSVLTGLVDDMLQGKPFQAIALDRRGEGARQALDALADRLKAELTVPRRPLSPTRAPRVRGQTEPVTQTGPGQSVLDQVRSVVAQVSGYATSQILEDAHFERDLGIDTLKILDIIARLRGTILPVKFANFREATSVQRIVEFAAVAAPGDAAAVLGQSPAQAVCVDCYRHEVVTRRLDELPAAAAGSYRLVIEPSLEHDGADLSALRGLENSQADDVLLVWRLPQDPETLCRKTLPDLARAMVEAADRASAATPLVHLITLCAPDEYNPACYRALTGFAKSVQKDLRNLNVFYSHLDTLQPDLNTLRRLLANPLLGQRARDDSVVETGQLVPAQLAERGLARLAGLLGPQDVLLVTGGARGIAAAIVRALLPVVPCSFVLIGRRPLGEPWMEAEGAGRVQYYSADLTNRDAVEGLDLGSWGVTLVVHAAGVVLPRPIRQLTPEGMLQVLEPKILGLHRILERLDSEPLRGIVTFSSVAGFIGGDGQSDYGAANAYLAGFRFGKTPVLALGWSAWDEIGMAAEETTQTFLDLAGIELIPPDQGIAAFSALLTDFLEQPTSREYVIRAEMADTSFLPADPYRAAMVAPRGRPADLGPTRGLADDLAAITLPAPEALGFPDTRVLILHLPAAANWGGARLEHLYTAAERLETDAVAAGKRRQEKLAGKLAAKLLAAQVLDDWFGLPCPLEACQALAPEAPVEVTAPGQGALAEALSQLHFSISHTEELVCAAVSRRRVGVDVELLRPLGADLVREICGGDPPRSTLSPAAAERAVPPVVVFTQKEAVLKASGDGLAGGLEGVVLADTALDSLLSATYRGNAYSVLSTVHGNHAFSLAWAEEAGARKAVTASVGQEALWFLERLEGPSPAYAMAWTETLRGPLALADLRRALQVVTDRHEALRTSFRDRDGTCQAEVLSDLPVRFQLVDMSEIPASRQAADVARHCREEARRPFDLSCAPLWRALAYRLGPDHHVLLFVFHHSILDVTSALTLRRELAICYRALAAGRAPDLPPPPFQYGDYAREQRESLTGERLSELLDYWRTQIAGCPVTLRLPLDFRRPAVQAHRAEALGFTLPTETLARLRERSREAGVTLFATLLAAFQVLLMRLSGQEDLVVGTPFVGRQDARSWPAVGFFTNVLPLRSDLSGNPRFWDVLPHVRDTVMEALEHQDLPFLRLVQELAPERHPDRSPLVQAIFRLLHLEGDSVSFGIGEQEFQEVLTGSSAYDLSLVMEVGDRECQGRMEYDCALFAPASVQRLVDRFLSVLAAVAANPTLRLAEIPIMTEAERHEVLTAWNDTERPLPTECLHTLFAARAARDPEAVAFVCGDEQMTYAELAARANQLAHYLRRRGLQPGSPVAIAMDRSPALLVAILGILKAGGAYVPLDPSYPGERLAMMLADSGARVLLTAGQSPGLAMLPAVETTCLDRDWALISAESTAAPEDLAHQDDVAYIMYTSGSTGRPKGVAVTHRNVVRLVFGADYCDFGPEQTFLHMAPISFDASTFEVWGALLHGSKCVLLPDRVPSLDTLGRVLDEQRVTTLWLTASLFNAIIDEAPGILRGLRQLLTGGEALSADHVRKAQRLLPNTRLINGYGPTETTTFACCCEISWPVPEDAVSIPIGRPIGNTQAYILDQWLQPVPLGAAGELCIGGEGVARGYVNDSELTAARFVPDPFSRSQARLLYRTGDQVRVNRDGLIEFLGRLDDQVKIRGFRVELGEVEAAVRQCPRVREAVLVACEGQDGDRRLAAYVVPASPEALTPRELQAALRSKLPDYMVPPAFILMPSLPLSPNGKVDRRALPEPGWEDEAGTAFEPPRDELEAQLAAIWETLLPARPIGVRQGFFELGGHSLLAVRVCAAIARATGHRVPVATLFQAQTIERLALLMRGEQALTFPPTIVPIQPCGNREPVFFVAAVEQLCALSTLLGPGQPLFCVRGTGFEPDQNPDDRTEDVAAQLVADLLAVKPHGPYHLGGYSYGAVVAFEMARQLQNHGHEVGLVFLLDPAPIDVNALCGECLEPRGQNGLHGFTAGSSRQVSGLLERILTALRIPLSPRMRRRSVAKRVLRSARAYRPTERFKGNMVLVVGEAGARESKRWENLCEGEVQSHILGGARHLWFLETSSVPIWGGILRELLVSVGVRLGNSI